MMARCSRLRHGPMSMCLWVAQLGGARRSAKSGDAVRSARCYSDSAEEGQGSDSRGSAQPRGTPSLLRWDTDHRHLTPVLFQNSAERESLSLRVFGWLGPHDFRSTWRVLDPVNFEMLNMYLQMFLVMLADVLRPVSEPIHRHASGKRVRRRLLFHGPRRAAHPPPRFLRCSFRCWDRYPAGSE